MQTATHSIDTVHKWITLLWPESYGRHGDLHICRPGHWRGQHCRSAAEVLAYVDRWAPRGPKGIYLRSTTVAGELSGDPARRGGIEDARDAPGLFADLDIAGPGHRAKPGALPPDEAGARSVVATSGLPEPTAWVHSGGGLVPWWLLREPIALLTPQDRARWTDLGKAWEGRLREASRSLGWGMDSTLELARAMRLPGTLNRKVRGDGRPCLILSDDGPRYELATLQAALPAVATPLTPRRGGWSNCDPYSAEQARRLCADALGRLKGARGQLNSQLNDAAMIVGHFVPAVYDSGEATELLLRAQTVAWSAMTGEPDDGDYVAALATIRSGLAAGMRDPARIGRPSSSRTPPRTAVVTTAPADEYRTGTPGMGGKPRINVANKAETLQWLTEELGRGELSGVFSRGSTLIYTPRVGESGYVPPKSTPETAARVSDGPAQVCRFTPDTFISMIDRRYDVGVLRAAKSGSGRWSRTLLPREVARRCVHAAGLGEGVPHLRRLETITHTPIVRLDGSIIDTPGYDDTARILYLPEPGMGEVHVPRSPSRADIEKAVDIIRYPISKFPFVSNEDEANWIGAALIPLLREIAPPPYPLLLIDAPTPGSGKGFLAGIIGAVHGMVMRPGIPSTWDEWNKVIMTILSSTTSPMMVFDNVRGIIRSSALEGLLTSEQVTDRVLGKNDESLSLRNDRLWAMTGNNAKISGDLARRVFRVVIDAKMPHPEARVFNFNPVRWTEAHRVQYIGAMLTMIRGWILSGAPKCDSERSDTYSELVGTVRGILKFSGIDGVFWDTEGRREIGLDDEDLRNFLTEIYEVMGPGVFAARQVAECVEDGSISRELIPAVIALSGSRPSGTKFVRQLGSYLSNNSGRWAEDVSVKSCGKGRSGPTRNIALYRIERI